MPLAVPQLFMLNWILETVGRTLYWNSISLLSFKGFVGNSTNSFRIRKFVLYVNGRWQMDVSATSSRPCCNQRAFAFRIWDPRTCWVGWFNALSQMELKSMSQAVGSYVLVDDMVYTTRWNWLRTVLRSECCHSWLYEWNILIATPPVTHFDWHMFYTCLLPDNDLFLIPV